MTVKELDQQLHRFNLTEHGDSTEKYLWSLVKEDFQNYERFWRQYIVPLTFRLRPDLPQVKQIRIRPAARRFERMAMSHYSVFFYLAYATERIRTAQPNDRLLPHDAFYRLGSSIDNVQHFLDALTGVSGDLGVSFHFPAVTGGENSKPPDQNQKPSAIREILEYRGALLHNPVIGRAINQGAEKLPTYQHLDPAKQSWFYSEKLVDHERVGTKELLERLQGEYCAYLNSKWSQIITSLDEKRDKFVRHLNLDETDDEYINVSMPWAGSGTFVVDTFAGARSDVHEVPLPFSRRISKQPKKYD